MKKVISMNKKTPQESVTISLKRYHELLKFEEAVKARKAIGFTTYGHGFTDYYFLDSAGETRVLWEKIEELQKRKDELYSELYDKKSKRSFFSSWFD